MDGELLEFSSVYWEFLEKQYSIDDLKITQNRKTELFSATISRDDDYFIHGDLEGFNPTLPLIHQKKVTPGKPIPKLTIRGKDKHGHYSYKLEDCYISGPKNSWSKLDTNHPICKVNADLQIGRIKITSLKVGKPARLIDWYLNGLHNVFIFPRATMKDYTKKLVLTKPGTNIPTLELQSGSGGGTAGYAIVKTGSYGIIISEVPDGFNPEWSKKISIEYNTAIGMIPDQNERYAISELLSFVLGRQLIHIGHTVFDEKNGIIERMAKNPWRRDISHLCRKGNLPPVNIGMMKDRVLFERLFEELLPQYLWLRDKLKLDEVLWRYWIGSDLPIGTNIPIMASGIEILAKNWFKSGQSMKTGVSMDSGEFTTLFSDEFKAIEKKLKGRENAEILLRKMKNACNLGSNERLELFYSDLNIELNEWEEKASQYRNIMIHDAIDLTKTEFSDLVKCTYAYKALFNKVILRALGYSGTYIDYSRKGWPLKKII